MRVALLLSPLRLAGPAFASACASDAGGGGAGTTSTSISTSTSTSTNTMTTSSSISGSSSSSSGTGGTGGTGGMGGTDGGADAKPFSLLSLNLHCFKNDGTVFATNAERFAAIASLAASREVSVIAVQEACKRPGEEAIVALRAALEQSTGAVWSSSWTSAHVAWQGTPDEAEEGVGLLVRGALSDAIVIDHAVQGAFRRVAVSASLPPELAGARVTSVHFEVFGEPTRAAQAREAAVAALVDTDPGFSAIVAGDFNDVEGSNTVSAFPSMGYLDATAGLDPTGIDHVMIHRATPLRPSSVERVFLGAEAVSDHPGILVRLTPAPGDVVSPTRVRALHDPGAGHHLALRGDQAPLSWGVGHAMRRKASGEHALVCTELEGSFAFKTLIDDATWQAGADVAGEAGKDNVTTPTF